MSSYNGLISSLIKGQSGGAVLTGLSYSVIADAVPRGNFESATFGVVTTGVSGTYAVFVVGAVGGATAVIAGATGIGANGSTILGTTGGITGVPRPAYVQYASAEAASGFTASVFMSATY